MTQGDLVAVLDVGKTHAKVTVATPAGEIVAEHRRTNTVREDGEYPHLDAPTVFGWLVECLAKVRAHIPVESIGTIVPVTHGAAAALMSGDQLALPVLDYEFEGPDEMGDEYPAPPFAETGSPPLPAGLNLGRQLYWQARRFPDAFARVDRILPYPQYFAHRLTGVAASEVTSLGCHTDLWAPDSRCYSSLARGQAWDRRFASLAFAGDRIGKLSAEVRERTGLSPQCDVLVGLHDSNASLWCHRATHEPPFAVVSTGTWVVVLAPGGKVHGKDAGHDVLANVDARGEPVPTARFMGGREFEVLTGGRPPVSDLQPAELQALIDSGTIPIPSFASQGGAHRDLRGKILGPHPTTDRAWAALGTLYCALLTDEALDRIEAQGPCIIEGSFTTTRAFGEILAALRPAQPMYTATESTGTLAGALTLARPQRSAVPPGFCTAQEFRGLEALRDRWRAEIAQRSTR